MTTENSLIEKSAGLNEQQFEMLRLFKHPMPDKDYKEIKRLVVKILAKEIDGDIQLLENEKGWTEAVYEQWGNEHLRSSNK